MDLRGSAAASREVTPGAHTLRRTALAAMIAVVLVVAGVFAALVASIEHVHHQADQRHRNLEAVVTADQSERSVVDLETGLRGFLLTRQERFLQPYWAALKVLPQELASLRAEVANTPIQATRATDLAASIASYEQHYAQPLAASGAMLSPARVVAVTSAGKRLLDGIRAQFDTFGATEQQLERQSETATSTAAHESLIIAPAGFLITVLVLGALAAMLQRWILVPVRRVAEAAARRQGGEPGVRVEEAGHGEVLSLARSFNAMAEALEERSQALMVARDRLQGVLDHATAIIYIKDSAGRYLLVNRAFEEARDLQTVNVLGHTERDLSPLEVAEQIAADDRAVAEHGATLSNEYTVPTIRGMRTFWSIKFPIPSPDGEITIGGISTDVTEQKQALSAAMEASRLKTNFVANMSHKIRTPLSGVIGLTTLLRETDLQPVQREYVEALSSSGEALMSVIGEILDFSKIEAGRLDLDRTDFELRVLVEESCLMVAERAHAKGLELSHWVEEDVPEFVRGDRNRLRQILLNLLSNAVKFTAEGEVVVKVLRSTNGMLRFEVLDTGIGITADQTGSLFEAFSQADESTTREYGGTGLGLTIARELVALMGGEIAAVPREQSGSLFWFTAKLPVTAAPAGAGRPKADLAGLRALIVDDNQTIRTVLRQYLGAWGLHCDTLDSPSLALDALERAKDEGRPYQLALLDYHMPGMDGIELASAINDRPALRTTAIVMLTSSVKGSQAAEEAGIAHHLLKPPRQSDLYDAIASAIGVRSGQRAPETAPKRPSPATRVDRPLVLVAEDNEVNQIVAATMLEQRGLRIELAHNGAEAIEMNARGKYAAIFMDCQMPELDGYAATGRIRATEGDRRTPIIAMTAHSMPGDREKCLAAGMDDYLTKPIQPAQLDSMLARWLPSNGHRAGGAAEANGASGNGGDPLDVEVLARLEQDLDPGMRERLLDTFERSLEDRLADIDAALDRGDEQKLRRILHLLKGSSATMGARALSNACAAAEQLVGSERDALVEELAHLGELASHSVAELRVRFAAGRSAAA
jgi:two-component system sensor histidine kinase/response regulator